MGKLALYFGFTLLLLSIGISLSSFEITGNTIGTSEQGYLKIISTLSFVFGILFVYTSYRSRLEKGLESPSEVVYNANWNKLDSIVHDSSELISYQNHLGEIFGGLKGTSYIPRGVMNEIRNNGTIVGAIDRGIKSGKVKIFDPRKDTSNKDEKETYLKLFNQAQRELRNTEKHLGYKEFLKPYYEDKITRDPTPEEKDFLNYIENKAREKGISPKDYAKRHQKVSKGDVHALATAAYMAFKTWSPSGIISNDSHLSGAINSIRGGYSIQADFETDFMRKNLKHIGITDPERTLKRIRNTAGRKRRKEMKRRELAHT